MEVEKMWGVHYAMGGTGAIVEGLGRFFAELGGQVCLNTEVRQIVIRSGKAVGVRLADGAEVAADVVVSNSDVATTYQRLIPEAQQHAVRRLRYKHLTAYSFSLFVVYFGTKKRYPDAPLLHHNVMMTDRYYGLLRDVHSGRNLPKDFALYLHMPTRTDPTIAPDGHESFYVLSVVPNLRAPIDWASEGVAYRERILQYLEDHYLPDLRANIVALHHIDPVHFEQTLNSHLGAAFSVRPSLLQSAWMRPHNRSGDYGNLYFVGAGTHPGAGVPAVFSSGKIVADLIAAEAGK
jgi:phytoene desaturase